MDLEKYKKWYTLYNGHFYTSKVKQINRDLINEMLKYVFTYPFN